MSANPTPGWIYVLESTKYRGIVKIGRTSRNAPDRIFELDRAKGYGAFGPWSEVRSIPVADIEHVEAAAHRMLAHKRVRLTKYACREMFRVDTNEACNVVGAAAEASRARAVWSVPQPRAGSISRTRWQAPSRTLRRMGRWKHRLVALVFCILLAWALDPAAVAAVIRGVLSLQ